MLKINSFKKSLLSLSIFATLALSTASTVLAGPSLFRGDFLSVHNTIAGGSDWTDSVSANPGDIVEFRVIVRNEGDMTVDHAQVIGLINEGTGIQIPFTATIKAPYGGGTQISDNATVNITGSTPQSFRYEPGHARIFGVTNLFNCPSGCDISDAVVAGGGMEVGDIPAGESVQVLYKARLSNLVSPTPTPVPACVSNDSCSVSTPSACGQTNTGVDNCGKACSRSSDACAQGQTQTQSQSQTVNITNPTPTAAPATPVVTTLPKTGLPAIAWLISALIPTGFGLRRFKGIEKELEDDPNYIWEDRKFKSH